MASRALPDLIARIRVDSSGVDSAMTNLIGSFGRANLALAGVAAGLGVLILGGKSMIDISEKHDRATQGLAQAVAAYNDSIGKTAPLDSQAGQARAKAADVAEKANDGLKISTNNLTLAQLGYSDAVKKHGSHSEEARKALLHLDDANIRYRQSADAAKDATDALAAATAELNVKRTGSAIVMELLQANIDEFIRTNRRYISDQSDVIDGYAKLTRSGASVDEVQKDMNRALDLAALKHISLSDAVDLLVKAESGRLKGLIDLGISTGKYTDAQGNLVNGTKDVGKAMAELDAKTKGGRDTLTALQKSSNTLSNDWQDLSNKGGPVLLILLDKVVGGVSAIYDWFDRTGKDDKLWATISKRLVDIATWIKQYILDPLKAAGDAVFGFVAGHRSVDLSKIPVGSPGYDPTKDPYSPMYIPRASGGPVLPGGIYTVGEQGPETLVMGSGGGRVIPHGTGDGGSLSVVVNAQTNADAHDIAVDAAWELRKMRRAF